MSRVHDRAPARQGLRWPIRLGTGLLLALVLLTAVAATTWLTHSDVFGQGRSQAPIVADGPTPSIPCPGSPLHC